MNKKILLGSILSVVILILVSFTSVVGYRSVAFDVKASPLFNIRTNMAIDEESVELRCAYVGKGDTFQLPKRNSKIVLVQKFVERISDMDDRSFNDFSNFICRRMQLDENLNTEHILQIKYTLNILRKKPDVLTKYYNERIIEEQPLDITSGEIWCKIFDRLFEMFVSLVLLLALIKLCIQSWFAGTGTDCVATFMCPPTNDWPCS